MDGIIRFGDKNMIHLIPLTHKCGTTHLYIHQKNAGENLKRQAIIKYTRTNYSVSR